MREFRVLHGDEVIGTSSLEVRDAGMGMARGRFLPTPAYQGVRGVFRIFADAQREAGPASEELVARYYEARDGLALRLESDEGHAVPVGFVHIEDVVEDDDDASECEVEVEILDASFFSTSSW